MSKTYRNTPDGGIGSDGRRHLSAKPESVSKSVQNRPGRYRPGSRQKKRNLVAYPVRRNEPDLAKLGRAIIRAAMLEAEAEAEAGIQRRPYSPGPARRASSAKSAGSTEETESERARDRSEDRHAD